MQREIDAFQDALERSPSERVAFIEARHADDPEFVRRVVRLLVAHERAEGAAAAAPLESDADAIDPSPQRIGRYRVLERLGEGGMGVVYAAEQTEPFRRRVAIKVIKLGMDTREVIARFEAERQALAMMDHPAVAKAFDAGVTEQGRPYFVMELVKGLSLTEYCVKHRLSLRDRLRLFTEVCAGIQHAHQKGIIHRDVKPSNILVTMQDGRAVPKVIDFGVAKATASRLTERTVFTEQGRLIGTPEYMSPEQAEMSGLDVDTRTDVYSLGVLLYELLTGALPFDSKSLRSGGYSEILRIIREVDPPRPSVRLAEIARRSEDAPADIAARVRALRGDLDWIVMRALEKDRTRRYRGASSVADDIERYLNDLPVIAGPPGVAYRLRKFVKRHRYATAMIALAVVSTLVGIAGLATGLVRARAAEALATRRANNAQAAAGFLKRVLFQTDPEFGGGSLTLTQVMENAGRLIGEDLGTFPEVEASVRESLGVAYRRRSLFVEADPHLQRSLEIRREQFGDDHPETASSYIAMANLLFEHEGRIDESLALLRRAGDCYERHGMMGSAAEAWLQLDIGNVTLAADRLAEAEIAFRRCHDLLKRHRGTHHPDVSRALRGIALVALARGDREDAERLAREAVALCVGEQDRYIRARAQMVLSQALLVSGELEDASDLLDQTGAQFLDTVGMEHIRIAERHAVLAELHLSLREFKEADFISERCEAIRRGILHADHWAILHARLLRTRAKLGLGDLTSAVPALDAIEQALATRLGVDHPLLIEVASARVDCAIAAQDERARRSCEQRLAALRDRRAERLRGERLRGERLRRENNR